MPAASAVVPSVAAPLAVVPLGVVPSAAVPSVEVRFEACAALLQVVRPLAGHLAAYPVVCREDACRLVRWQAGPPPKRPRQHNAPRNRPACLLASSDRIQPLHLRLPMPALRTAAFVTLIATGGAQRRKKVPRPREIEVFERYEAPPPEDADPNAPWHTQPMTRAEEVAIQEEAAEVTGRGSGMRVAWAGNSLTFWNDLPALLEEFADVDRGGPSSLAVATCVRSGAGLASLSEDGCGQAFRRGPTE